MKRISNFLIVLLLATYSCKTDVKNNKTTKIKKDKDTLAITTIDKTAENMQNLKIDTNILPKYIDSLDNPNFEHYYTENFKKADREFYIKDEREYDGEVGGYDPKTCCCGIDGLKVKEIKGNYVLYEGLLNSELYLYTRLVNKNGKTLIDGLGLVNMPMINENLKESLWREVFFNNQKFIDANTQNNQEIIDDYQNGYLKIGGVYNNDNGCYCEATVVAFEDKYGFYTFLKQYTESCDYINNITSNILLSEILPENFGLQTFIPNAKYLPKVNNAIFTLNFQMPRKYGDDTKVKLKMLPLGLLFESNEAMVYYHSKSSNSKHFQAIRSFAQNDDKKLLNLLKNQNIVDLDTEKQTLLSNKLVGNNNFNSLQEVQSVIDNIKLTYTYYTAIKYDSLILNWNKDKAKLYIKKTYNQTDKKMSFIEFIIQSDYYDELRK